MLVCVPYITYRVTIMQSYRTQLLTVKKFTSDKQSANLGGFWPLEGRRPYERTPSSEDLYNSYRSMFMSSYRTIALIVSEKSLDKKKFRKKE